MPLGIFLNRFKTEPEPDWKLETLTATARARTAEQALAQANQEVERWQMKWDVIARANIAIGDQRDQAQAQTRELLEAVRACQVDRSNWLPFFNDAYADLAIVATGIEATLSGGEVTEAGAAASVKSPAVVPEQPQGGTSTPRKADPPPESADLRDGREADRNDPAFQKGALAPSAPEYHKPILPYGGPPTEGEQEPKKLERIAGELYVRHDVHVHQTHRLEAELTTERQRAERLERAIREHRETIWESNPDYTMERYKDTPWAKADYKLYESLGGES